jgi:hypothetical protein
LAKAIANFMQKELRLLLRVKGFDQTINRLNFLKGSHAEEGVNAFGDWSCDIA